MLVAWTRLVMDLAQGKDGLSDTIAKYSMWCRVCLGSATALVIWWIAISCIPAEVEELPIVNGDGDKYFIAVNLYNNEPILPNFMEEMTLLISHRKSLFFRRRSHR